MISQSELATFKPQETTYIHTLSQKTGQNTTHPLFPRRLVTPRISPPHPPDKSFNPLRSLTDRPWGYHLPDATLICTSVPRGTENGSKREGLISFQKEPELEEARGNGGKVAGYGIVS